VTPQWVADALAVALLAGATLTLVLVVVLT